MIEQDREAVDAAVVSDLRRATGRFPQDARLAELIHDLSTGNRGFADLWATGTVAAHREDHKTIEHPSVGPVTVDCDVLTDGDSDLKIVISTRNEDRVSWWRADRLSGGHRLRLPGEDLGRLRIGGHPQPLGRGVAVGLQSGEVAVGVGRSDLSGSPRSPVQRVTASPDCGRGRRR
ncbi:hypothetical protein GCM10012278_83890 [Nonomuraea glycinis]|uniref:MmyB-like transcription regulator ligand binding domain-containing protein n=1 Tax=Nonomuraea glycinis TaxID=2047744 RepID=A0A918AF24_9ACTN|nr:hypothetical protein GCM10012278_83890 [Nonomuraea glycinis]